MTTHRFFLVLKDADNPIQSIESNYSILAMEKYVSYNSYQLVKYKISVFL